MRWKNLTKPPVEAAVPAANPPRLQATRPFGDRSGQALPLQRAYEAAFTLVELVVTVGVLVLLVFLFTQLLNSAATVTTLGHKRMDVDSQAREVLDRMAIDFSQMLKRSDVDYYLKSPGNPQTGNDQIAFYTALPGYFGTVPAPAPGSTSKSPVSLVAYRIDPNSTWSAYNRMERLGHGLAWNAFSASWPPVMFLPQTIIGTWGTGVNSVLSPSSEVSSEYEVIGPQVFRFEYYYLVRGQFEPGAIPNPTPIPSATPPFLTTIPWDTTCACPSATPTIAPSATPTPIATPTPTPVPTPLPPAVCCHLSPQGMQDVVAIVVDIAVIDPKSRGLVTNAQLARLNGADGVAPILVDYAPGMAPGQLLTQWRAALDANAIGLPQPAISGIRLYERYLYLSPPTLNTP